MPNRWYEWNKWCPCRLGCQTFRRMGAVLQYRIPGSTGYLADLSDWVDVPFTPPPLGSCVYELVRGVYIYSPPFIFADHDLFTSVNYADQHARFMGAFLQRTCGPFNAQLDWQMSLPFVDLISCQVPPTWATVGTWSVGGLLAAQVGVGDECETRWK